MAKFKVGDRVAYYGKDPAIYRKRGRVSDVSQIRGETFVTVDLDDGEEWGAPEKDWTFMNSRACSTNAVVAKALNACGTARNAESPEDYDGNMHQVISLIAHDLEKTVLQLGKAVSLWEKADKSEYAKGEAEKALALDRRLYSLVTGALQYMRKAEQASA
jgi:hypothetical protein